MGYEITDADMANLAESGKVAIMESLILAVMAEAARPPGEIANFDRDRGAHCSPQKRSSLCRQSYRM